MMDYNDHQDFIIWDDAKSLVHIFRANVNYDTQAEAPMIVTTAEYDTIQYMEAEIKPDMLEAAIDATPATAKQKAIILKFVESLHNHDMVIDKAYPESGPWSEKSDKAFKA